MLVGQCARLGQARVEPRARVVISLRVSISLDQVELILVAALTAVRGSQSTANESGELRADGKRLLERCLVDLNGPVVVANFLERGRFARALSHAARDVFGQ